MAISETDDGLLAFANNLYTTAQPRPTAFGFTAQQMTNYNTTLTRYAAALAASKVIETRTRGTTAAKRAAKKTLLNSTRSLYKVADGWPEQTDENRVLLGITVRKQPSPKPAPKTAPAVTLVSVVGRTATIRVQNSAKTGKRARPAGTSGAWVYSYVGDEYPSDPALWSFEGATTKSTHEVTFDNSVAGGTQVWITAAWINAKSEAGPVAVPISTNLQGGGKVSADGKMKIAA